MAGGRGARDASGERDARVGARGEAHGLAFFEAEHVLLGQVDAGDQRHEIGDGEELVARSDVLPELGGVLGLPFAAAAGPVLGVCNGFQVLLEAGLLPGGMRRNRHLEFICQHVHVRVEQSDTPFTCNARAGQVLRAGWWSARSAGAPPRPARGGVAGCYNPPCARRLGGP